MPSKSTITAILIGGFTFFVGQVMYAEYQKRSI